MRNFVWTWYVVFGKVVIVLWDDCCLLLDEKGLNIKRLIWLNKSLLCMLIFKVSTKFSFVYFFLHDQFFKHGCLLCVASFFILHLVFDCRQ